MVVFSFLGIALVGNVARNLGHINNSTVVLHFICVRAMIVVARAIVGVTVPVPMDVNVIVYNRVQ